MMPGPQHHVGNAVPHLAGAYYSDGVVLRWGYLMIFHFQWPIL